MWTFSLVNPVAVAMMGSRCSHHLGEVLSKKDAKAKGSVDLGETTGGVPNGKTGVSARVLRPKSMFWQPTQVRTTSLELLRFQLTITNCRFKIFKSIGQIRIHYISVDS